MMDDQQIQQQVLLQLQLHQLQEIRVEAQQKEREIQQQLQELQEQQQQQQGPPFGGKRRVHFAANTSVRYLESDDDGAANAQRSVLTDEFSKRKEKRRQEADACKSQGYGFLVMDSFQDPIAHVQKQITLFARLPDDVCGRGLERQVSNKHDWERREWRAKCVQNVLAAEARLRYQGGWNDEDQFWEELAKVSKTASRSAKRFARRLGKADEMVVKEGELEDVGVALTAVEEIKALQLKRNFEKKHSSSASAASPSSLLSQHNGSFSELLESSSLRSLNSGGRRSLSGSSNFVDEMNQSFSGRLRHAPHRSLSDHALDGAIPKRHLDFDRNSSPFDEEDDNSSLKKLKRDRRRKARRKSKERQETSSSSVASPPPVSPSPKKRLLKRWNSLKKLAAERSSGATQEAAPESPQKRRSSTKSTSTVATCPSTPSSVVPESPVLAKESRRGMLQRWNSWSIGNSNSSVGSLAKRSPDLLPKSPATSYSATKQQRRKLVEREFSLSFSSLPRKSNSDHLRTDHRDQDDMSEASGGGSLEDSVVFHRRRARQARTAVPTLATLEEGDLGESTNSGSSKSFFAKWSARRNANKEPMKDDSNESLDIADLAGGEEEDDDHDDSTISTVGTKEKARERGGDDFLPKAPPTTQYALSPRKTPASPRKLTMSPRKMPSLATMSPRKTPAAANAPSSPMTTKKLQLLKAERWASSRFAQSSSVLGTVDEMSQHQDTSTIMTEMPRRKPRSRSLYVRSRSKEEEDNEPSTGVGEETPKKMRTLRRILNRWNSSSSKLKGFDDASSVRTTPVNSNHHDRSEEKPRRGRLSRWSSSSGLLGRKNHHRKAAAGDEDDTATVGGNSTVVDSPSLLGSEQQSPPQKPRRRRLRRTYTTPELSALNRKGSDSTIESSTEPASPSPPTTPTKEQKLKQNLIFRLKTRGNLLVGQGRSSSKLYLGGRSSRSVSREN